MPLSSNMDALSWIPPLPQTRSTSIWRPWYETHQSITYIQNVNFVVLGLKKNLNLCTNLLRSSHLLLHVSLQKTAINVNSLKITEQPDNIMLSKEKWYTLKESKKKKVIGSNCNVFWCIPLISGLMIKLFTFWWVRRSAQWASSVGSADS